MRGLAIAGVAFALVALSASGCRKEDGRKVEDTPMGKLSGKKVLMVFASRDFRDEELKVPQAKLSKAGAAVTLASSTLDEAAGMLGATARADLLLKDARAADYDAVVFVGGSGATEFFDDPAAHGLARDAAARGKVLAAICIAPSILANAGLLDGKQATGFPSEKDNLEARGASYTGGGVTVDGKILTADGPKSAAAFADALVRLLAP